MKLINNLELGFSDAENYRRRENKSLLNKVFIRNHNLDRLCDPAISFLIGEKGTGKTAYAVYLANNDYLDTLSSLRYIRETEYQKFIALKNEKHLGLSEYSSIWKVTIYLLLAQQIIEKEGGIEFLRRFTRLHAIQKAIDEYYHKAFSPEIIQALHFVQESKIAAELIAKHAKASGEEKDTLTFSESKFQTNLFYIQKKFEEAFRQARLDKNHLLFIDGIDIRPSSIPYEEYLLCIKGLANAVWEVNNDFFPTIKGKCGRMRASLLIRPDIFQSIGLQNQNTKIRDNSVFLDWRTEYTNHRTSDLFRVIDHLLSSQQDRKLDEGEAWDHYFPWDAPNILEKFDHRTSFISFLRWSYYRPRDIVTMLAILQGISKQGKVTKKYFKYEMFDNTEFKRVYSEYLLGEVKDHLTFYYGEEEYNLFLKFFKHLNGRNKFSYEEYLAHYGEFYKSISSSSATIPKFMSTASDFLQFLYSLNILSYIEYPVEDKPYIRWCFRQRSYGDINPKVKEGCDYQIFYGLYKALNVGQEFSK